MEIGEPHAGKSGPQELASEPADQHFVLRSHEGEPLPNRRYRVRSGKRSVEGFTDADGRTRVLTGVVHQLIRFQLLNLGYDEHFILKDPQGRPLGGVGYRIESPGGVVLSGVTDAAGRTARYTSEQPEEVRLYYVAPVVEDDEGAG